MQCPRCGILCDVPTLDDLPNLNPDGTYHFTDEPGTASPAGSPPRPSSASGPPRPRVVPTLYDKSDTQDLRPSLDDFLKAGTNDTTFRREVETPGGAPKHPRYDPETGKLIRPLATTPPVAEVVTAPDARRSAHRGESVSPSAPPNRNIHLGRPVLGYARRTNAVINADIPGFFAPFTRVFRPINLLAWLLPLVIYIVITWFIQLPLVGILGFFFIYLPLLAMMIGHLGNIVDEMGPQARDELPVLFRNVSLREDVLYPGLRVVVAFLAGVAPAIILRMQAPDLPEFVHVLAFALSYLVFPAILLTVCTSGALNNLLPHRIFGVIPHIGLKYFLLCFVWAVAFELLAFGTYAIGMIGVWTHHFMMWTPSTIPGKPGAPLPTPSFTPLPDWLERGLGFPALLLSVYLIHVFGWQLGILYRRYQPSFPWVFQRYDSSTRTDTTAQLHRRNMEAREALARNAVERSVARAEGGRGQSQASPQQPTSPHSSDASPTIPPGVPVARPASSSRSRSQS